MKLPKIKKFKKSSNLSLILKNTMPDKHLNLQRKGNSKNIILISFINFLIFVEMRIEKRNKAHVYFNFENTNKIHNKYYFSIFSQAAFCDIMSPELIKLPVRSVDKTIFALSPKKFGHKSLYTYLKKDCNC